MGDGSAAHRVPGLGSVAGEASPWLSLRRSTGPDSAPKSDNLGGLLPLPPGNVFEKNVFEKKKKQYFK